MDIYLFVDGADEYSDELESTVIPVPGDTIESGTVCYLVERRRLMLGQSAYGEEMEVVEVYLHVRTIKTGAADHVPESREAT